MPSKKKNKYYKTYAVVNRAINLFQIFGYDTNTGKQVGSAKSEEEAVKMRNYLQIKANIYFDLYNRLASQLVNLKANQNQSQFAVVNFNEIVDDAFKNCKEDFFNRQQLINGTLKSSVQTFEYKLPEDKVNKNKY